MALFTQLIGAGRPDVVFLHGLFGRGKNWAGIARTLAEHEHTSVLFDLPNHGRSHWTETFDYEAMADEVAAELRLRLGSAAAVTLVGHSMGGKVAMLTALAHPELVSGLVVVDIAPGPSAQVDTFTPLVAALRSLDLTTLGSRAEADERLRARIPDDAVRLFLLQNLRRKGGWHWQPNLALLGSALETIGGWPEIDATPFTGPVLWLAGEHSTYVSPVHEPEMRRLFPAVEKVVVPGAGHWVHADAPEFTLDALLGFAERVSPPSRP